MRMMMMMMRAQASVAILAQGIERSGPRQTELIMASQQLAAMDWGEDSDATKQRTLNFWMRQARVNDKHNVMEDDDIFSYLERKAVRVAIEKKKPNSMAWEFSQADRSDLLGCMCWADGSHTQCDPYLGPIPGD